MELKEDRLRIFLDSLEGSRPEYLNSLEEEARRNRVPVIRKEVQGLLKFLIVSRQPERVLEIGTAVGFSSLLMAEYGTDGMQIITIESNGQRAAEAERNIRAAGRQDRISVIHGDANDILPALEDTFDLVFMDAAKAQYIHYLEPVLSRMGEGSILVADNCLQGGDLLESKFAVARRDRTIHKRMREFLLAVNRREELTTTVLPLGDGVSLSVKR